MRSVPAAHAGGRHQRRAAPIISQHVRALLQEMDGVLGVAGESIAPPERIEVDDRFIGGGYAVATPESTDAIRLLAETEGIFLDPVYTAKAMAGLLSRIRDGRYTDRHTVLFWHTGGAPGLLA
jgi:1-aminocyclopropane-1-carboxylate deaminase/D-cysteine desulfhydrase-like pyridoxal-dependent ACC family enzyme